MNFQINWHLLNPCCKTLRGLQIHLHTIGLKELNKLCLCYSVDSIEQLTDKMWAAIQRIKNGAREMNQKNFNESILSSLNRIELRLILLNRKVGCIMATLNEVLKVVTDESGEEDSIIALLTGIKQQLADALAGTTLPADAQAKVDAIFQQATANSEKIAAAITANS